MYEKKTVTKRTVWVAQCSCGKKDVRIDGAALRSVYCADCKKWVDFKKASYEGKDKFDS